MKPCGLGLHIAWYLSACLLAVFVYFYGLDSQHIPKNGDEYPYEHITRLTAESGRLLPLQSDLDHMRNTKPPLLFWQGIASTDHGRNWTLWNLRYPSVIYTLLTATLLFMLGRKVSGKLETGFIAALTFLAFFSTYRYGRPFLTNPPEVFWIFLPFFVLLYWQKKFASRFAIPLLLGIVIGVGFLYKSFALGLPVAIGLAGWYIHRRRYHMAEFLQQDALKVVISMSVAVAIFSLWFVLDPDPLAVWREFVVGENVGKFDPHGQGYLQKLLWGGTSIWSFTLAFLSNAGLLTFPVIALCFVLFKRRRELSNEEKLLLLLVVAFFISFALPSQRSGRYMLDAMPAVALLCALNWQHIARWAYIATLLLAGVLVAGLGHLASRLQEELSNLYSFQLWSLFAVTLGFALLGIIMPRITRPLVNTVTLLVLLCFAAFLRPFDGALGSYSAEARNFAIGKEVGVPCNFRAMDEGYRFMLPGAKINGYNVDQNLSASDLAKRFPIFAIQRALNGGMQNGGCAECKIIGTRLDIRGRQDSSELKEMLLGGKVFEHLFVREILMQSPASSKAMPTYTPAQECR